MWSEMTDFGFELLYLDKICVGVAEWKYVALMPVMLPMTFRYLTIPVHKGRGPYVLFSIFFWGDQYYLQYQPLQVGQQRTTTGGTGSRGKEIKKIPGTLAAAPGGKSGIKVRI